MHSNHKIKTDKLSNSTLQHYGLSMSLGATLNTQCFFDKDGQVTEITWAGQITHKGSPYWHELKAVLMLSINQESLVKDMMKLDAATGYNNIQDMHQLAEKHCSGVDLSC